MASDRFWLVPLQVLIVLGLFSAASTQPENSFVPYDIEGGENIDSGLYPDLFFYPLEFKSHVHKRETTATTQSAPHGIPTQSREPVNSSTQGTTPVNTNSSVTSTEQTKAADGPTEKTVKDKDDSKKKKEDSSDKNVDNKSKYKKFMPSTEKSVTPDTTNVRKIWMNATQAPPTTARTTDVNTDVTDDLGDISISGFPNQDYNNKTLTQHNITATQYDNHKYYNSTFIVNETLAKQYWVDLDSHPDLKINHVLSKSHRRAATVELKFDFPFYGHKVRNITIATGGFLYTGKYVHAWLAATQYIAPLMANFDTTLSEQSIVKYADNGTAFTVAWERVSLQDKPKGGEFTFQVTLHKNGDIVFVYAQIPIKVERIEDSQHPVKIGLSDAYIMDRTIFFVRRKTIYEYHRVTFDRQDIRNWTVIYLTALPTCLDFDNCNDCVTKVTDFDCKWCSSLNQCSSGTSRNRQDWLDNGCSMKNIKEASNCPAKTDIVEPAIHAKEQSRMGFAIESSANVEPSQQLKDPSIGSLEHAPDKVAMSVSGVIGILLVVSLVAGLGAWVVYAYRNPHTTSGQVLIRYRPSQWSWRRGEARYTAATIHM